MTKFSKHKAGVSFSLWLISSILASIPIFLDYVNWYLQEQKNHNIFVKELVSSNAFYYGILSILLASLVELVLETGNKYVFIVLPNAVFDIITLVFYNISYFRPEFLRKAISNSNCKAYGIVSVFIVISIIMSLINIFALSIISKKHINNPVNMTESKRVKVY